VSLGPRAWSGVACGLDGAGGAGPTASSQDNPAPSVLGSMVLSRKLSCMGMNSSQCDSQRWGLRELPWAAWAGYRDTRSCRGLLPPMQSRGWAQPLCCSKKLLLTSQRVSVVEGLTSFPGTPPPMNASGTGIGVRGILVL
jgi:hypothetical protein